MRFVRAVSSVSLLPALAGCASAPPAVTVRDLGPNAVARWGERGAATINLPASPTGTPEERRPVYQLDLGARRLGRGSR
jgi:hypothetical protein